MKIVIYCNRLYITIIISCYWNSLFYYFYSHSNINLVVIYFVILLLYYFILPEETSEWCFTVLVWCIKSIVEISRKTRERCLGNYLLQIKVIRQLKHNHSRMRTLICNNVPTLFVLIIFSWSSKIETLYEKPWYILIGF